MYRLYLDHQHGYALMIDLDTQLGYVVGSVAQFPDLLNTEKFYKGHRPWEDWINECLKTYTIYTAENLSDFPELFL